MRDTVFTCSFKVDVFCIYLFEPQIFSCSFSSMCPGFEFIAVIFSLWDPYPRRAMELLKRVPESIYAPNIVILIFM